MLFFNKNIIVKFSCIFIFVILLCTGCSMEMLRKVFYYTHYASTFDKVQAEQMMRPGRNTIIVNSYTKHPIDSRIVTCAGQTSSIFPVTERAREHVKFLWGDGDGGQTKTEHALLELDRIQNHDPDFDQFKTEQVCNSSGSATFNKVGDGEFYIVSETPETRWAFGFMYAEKVKVQGGETKTVVLRGASRKVSILDDEDYQKMLKWKRLEKEWFIRNSRWDPKKRRRVPL